jgi:DNA-directed RNA polymerase specialized sigma24 family protein
VKTLPELLDRASAGEEQAEDLLIRELVDEVWSAAEQLSTRGDIDGRDLVFRAYTRVQTRLKDLKGRGHFRDKRAIVGYVRKAMTHMLLDDARERARREDLGTRAALQRALEGIEVRLRTTILLMDGFLERLDEDAPLAGQVFRCIRVDGLTLGQAANILGLTDEEVRSECSLASSLLSFERRFRPWTMDQLFAGMQRMNERQAQVFELVTLRAMPVSQVAARLGLGDQTVRDNHKAAATLLREFVKRTSDE